MSILSKIKAVISKMIPENEVNRLINQSIASSSEMRTAIETWNDVYKNKPPWEKKYTRKLNLGKAIAKELARLTLLECEIRVDNCDIINDIINDTAGRLRHSFEKALAKGGMAFDVYFSGGSVKVDFIDAENFFPTEFDDDGNITASIIVSRAKSGGKYYTKFEQHTYDAALKCEVITNYAFTGSSKQEVGRRCSLAEVPAWAEIPETITVYNTDIPLVAYFKVPFANTVDSSSPLGISVFEDCMELLEDADEQYTSFLWEYKGGELAVYADTTALISYDENGERKEALPEHDERLVRSFGGLRANGESFFKEFAPPLRDESYERGLETILRRVEFSASMAYGTLSKTTATDKTAEEIKASKQRSFAAVSEIQRSLQGAITQLSEIIKTYLSTQNIVEKALKLEFSFMWDDSIVRDSQREFTERLQLMSTEVIKPWEMRKWYLSESEEEAKRSCPETEKFSEE